LPAVGGDVRFGAVRRRLLPHKGTRQNGVRGRCENACLPKTMARGLPPRQRGWQCGQWNAERWPIRVCRIG
jgi:hypothetical protein